MNSRLVTVCEYCINAWWSIQGKKRRFKGVTVGEIHRVEKYYDKRFPCYNGAICESINFRAIM